MEKIKTLTVNGEAYQLWDGEAARIDNSKIGPDAWSGKNTVDKLCPSFSESGAIVACEALEGYPLTVTASAEATEITRTGKNIYNFKGTPSSIIGLVNRNGINQDDKKYQGFTIRLPVGTYTIHAERVGSGGAYLYARINNASGAWVKDMNIVASTTLQTYTFSIDEGDVLYVFSAMDGQSSNQAAGYFANFNLQLEIGNSATAYEPYHVEKFASDSGAIIPANAGVTTLWADVDLITVTGKQNPVRIIEKLTSAIIALGGNI